MRESVVLMDQKIRSDLISNVFTDSLWYINDHSRMFFPGIDNMILKFIKLLGVRIAKVIYKKNMLLDL